MQDTRDGAARHIVTGAAYVEQITALESDRRARSAFRDLVLKIAPPGAALFDFGSGTGMDARYYAERGFSVAAYDVDPQMCEFFAAHCRELIDAGRVTLESGGYREFLARKSVATGRGADLVTSNFAPLNLINDLPELFAKFHALTAPNGRVLASVLSPYFLGDLKYRWWWRNLPRLVRDGRFSVPGSQTLIVRRRLADFAAQSAPYFALEGVFRGLPAHPARPADAAAGNRTRGSWLRVTTCRYMFLLFGKRGASGSEGSHRPSESLRDRAPLGRSASTTR
jgi:SAM-dependent methyltransferase